MAQPKRRRHRFGAATACVALIATMVAAGSGAASAQTIYTGCLTDGQLTGVQVGNSPMTVAAMTVAAPAPPACGGGPAVSWYRDGQPGRAGAKGVKGERGKKGQVGADGKQGKTGPQGADGAEGDPSSVRTYTVVAGGSIAGDRLVALADCDAGDAVLGGGFETDGVILTSIGDGAETLTGWRAEADAASASSLTARVVCSDLDPLHGDPAP